MEKMKLNNKIQELINESESLKQKNNEVLGLAKNELSELVNTKAKENLGSLKNEFQGYVNYPTAKAIGLFLASSLHN